MLTLTRRAGERIYIGNDVVIEVVSVGPNRVQIGVRALRSIPIVRGELVEEVQQANRSAQSSSAAAVQRRNDALFFERGLLGFDSFQRWVLCDLAETPDGDGIGLRVLVAQDDPNIRLLVADLQTIAPSYPFEQAAEKSGLEGTLVYAAVINVSERPEGATVNLAAPLVLEVESRRGAQIVLGRRDLDVRTPLRSLLIAEAS